MQKKLLKAAANCVKPGGLLVYSTCSIEDCENSEQVEAFLKAFPEFVLERPSADIPSQFITTKGYLATLPFRDGIDGAFAACLRKQV